MTVQGLLSEQYLPDFQAIIVVSFTNYWEKKQIKYINTYIEIYIQIKYAKWKISSDLKAELYPLAVLLRKIQEEFEKWSDRASILL